MYSDSSLTTCILWCHVIEVQCFQCNPISVISTAAMALVIDLCAQASHKLKQLESTIE